MFNTKPIRFREEQSKKNIDYKDIARAIHPYAQRMSQNAGNSLIRRRNRSNIR